MLARAARQHDLSPVAMQMRCLECAKRQIPSQHAYACRPHHAIVRCPASRTPELYDNSEAERTLLQLGARWREMTKQPGAALPSEAAQLQQQQVRVMPLAQHRARSPETHHPGGSTLAFYCHPKRG